MAKQNEALFEESSQGAVSAVTALVLVVSLALIIGGMVVASYAFQPEQAPELSFTLFLGGLIATVIGFALPFNLVKSAK